MATTTHTGGRAQPLIRGRRQSRKIVAPARSVRSVSHRQTIPSKPETEPVTVVYVDYEMTEGDIKERLQAFGYGPDDDLTRLRYFTTPTINPLDTEHGAAEFLAAINEIGPDLVAIDTMSRAVSGEENESQTSNDLYRLTIMPLKAAGITVARADHLGKDKAKGARGSRLRPPTWIFNGK